MRRLFLLLLLSSSFAFAGEPIKVCVAQINGSEAKNWKLQSPTAQRLEQQGAQKQLQLSATLLTADNEKRAKTEAAEKGCGYVLLTTIETTHDQVFANINPNPYAKSEADQNRGVSATPAGYTLKYKVITPDGKKIGGDTIHTPLKQNPAPADFQETGNKMVDSLVTQVLSALTASK